MVVSLVRIVVKSSKHDFFPCRQFDLVVFSDLICEMSTPVTGKSAFIEPELGTI
jgi:hypothetical protein